MERLDAMKLFTRVVETGSLTAVAREIDVTQPTVSKQLAAIVRGGKPIADAKLEALHSFTAKVVRNRGFVPDDGVDAFLAAGYTKRNVLEVVLGVGTKTLSNYTNHIVHTQLDPFMKGAEWSKPASRAA